MLFSIHWRKNGEHGYSDPMLDDYDRVQKICNLLNRNRETPKGIFFWVVAEERKKFLVVSPVSRIVRAQFDTAKETALYMWGRDFNRYFIIKNNKVVAFREFEISAVEKVLEET